MHIEKSWVVLVAALITAVAAVVGAVITVDAKHDRERFEAALAEKNAEIEKLQRQVPGVATQESSKDSTTSLAGADKPKPPGQVKSPQQAPSPVHDQTPELTDPEPSNPVAPIPQKEEAGIEFQIQTCRQSGSEVTCEFLITNRQADRRLYLCADCGGRTGTESRIIDVQGNECRPTTASLGASSSRVSRATLTSGIPVKGSMAFGGCSPTSMLKLLEIGFLIERGDDGHQIQFYDVRIE